MSDVTTLLAEAVNSLAKVMQILESPARDEAEDGRYECGSMPAAIAVWCRKCGQDTAVIDGGVMPASCIYCNLKWVGAGAPRLVVK